MAYLICWRIGDPNARKPPARKRRTKPGCEGRLDEKCLEFKRPGSRGRQHWRSRRGYAPAMGQTLKQVLV
jgi:hypothetical protein